MGAEVLRPMQNLRSSLVELLRAPVGISLRPATLEVHSVLPAILARSDLERAFGASGTRDRAESRLLSSCNDGMWRKARDEYFCVLPLEPFAYTIDRRHRASRVVSIMRTLTKQIERMALTS